MMKKVSVEIFIPCFVDQLYPQTGMNMVKILEKLGCDVHYNDKQTCCGQPAFNAGFFKDAEEVAEKFIHDFNSKADFIVAPSASCVGMVKNSYDTLLKENAFKLQYKGIKKKIFELSEFIVDVLGVEAIEGAEFEGVVTYHDSCSGLRECHLYDQPRKLLQNVKGLKLVELKNNTDCCGFGGTFSVKFESISTAMGEQKVTHALETEAEYIVSTDASCLLHLNGYIQKNKKPIKTIHLADILASGW